MGSRYPDLYDVAAPGGGGEGSGSVDHSHFHVPLYEYHAGSGVSIEGSSSRGCSRKTTESNLAVTRAASLIGGSFQAIGVRKSGWHPDADAFPFKDTPV